MEEDMQRPSPQSQVLALARWEENGQRWLEGNYLGLISKTPYLQHLVGEGGTLWIVVSRRRPRDGRLYSLSFRLDRCELVTYASATRFGRYGVIGDPSHSSVFASNDARLLLLSLRFEPCLPIQSARKIGQSLQTPRRLNREDVRLLEEYALASDRWSVFISYQHADAGLAERLSAALQKSGVNVFRDKEALRGGEQWWPALEHAIRRSRYFVVLLGEETHRSEWVRREMRVALERGVRLIPVLAADVLANWQDQPELLKWHALPLLPGQWSSFMAQLLTAIGSPAISTGESRPS